jgi:hypothetical protein
VLEEAMPASSSYIGIDRHDTHSALAAGTGDGILVRERPGGAGEVSLSSASTSSHTAFDVSGFYNGGRYRRDEFARAWFCSGSGGVAYLVYPDGSAPDRAVDAI